MRTKTLETCLRLLEKIEFHSTKCYGEIFYLRTTIQEIIEENKRLGLRSMKQKREHSKMMKEIWKRKKGTKKLIRRS